jgi:hypothetical protein
MADLEDGSMPSIVLAGECHKLIKLIENLGDSYSHDPEFLTDQKLDIIRRLKRLGRAIQARGD